MNRRLAQQGLTDIPDPIGREHPSPGWREHGECALQPIEKPFWIETQSGEVIAAVVHPASFRAEVTRLPITIELDRCVVILIARPATNRLQSGTRS